jgi:hypothetical protein
VAIADLVPVLAGWIGSVGTPPFTADLNYLADAVPVIVVCAALAFWPAVGEESPYRHALPSAATRSVITFNAASVIVVSSLWSAHAYEAATTGQAGRSYIATARLALRQAPAGADIVSAPVPTFVMSRAFFGDASNTAAVLGPLAPRAGSVRWTISPEGAPHRLMIFDGDGRLWPAVVTGVSTAAPANAGTCWRLGAAEVQIPLQHSLYKWPWFAAFGYTGPETTVSLSFSGGWHSVELSAGHDDAIVPLLGGGSSVTVRNLGLAGRGCLTYLTVGTLQPAVGSSPVPAQPVSG